MISCIDLGGGKKYFFDGKTFSASLPPYKLLKFFFATSELQTAFQQKFSKTATKGLDRLNGFQFAMHLDDHLSIINRKCLSGKYSFSPYVEVLQHKGRNRPPRVISVPVIRDRLVLNQVKEILSRVFPECIPKSRANTLVHDISRRIKAIYAEGKSDKALGTR